MLFGKLGIADINYLWRGTLLTLKLCLTGIGLGLVIGAIFGILRANPRQTLTRTIAAMYIEFFRAVPLMLLFIVGYFGIISLGYDVSRFGAVVAAISLYTGAYIGQVVRAGIESVGRGQWEASISLGMSYVDTLRYVILPQAVKIMIPPAIGVIIGVVKGSSLASVVGYVELVLAGRHVIQRTYAPLLVMGTIAMIYFVICYPLSILSKNLERKL
jgi:polar amino acid transport system permease protein